MRQVELGRILASADETRRSTFAENQLATKAVGCHQATPGEGRPKAVNIRQLGLSRNTVAKAVASADPPSYSRPPVVTERVGWTGSASWFRSKVAAIKAEYAPNDPADRILYHLSVRFSAICGSPSPRSRSGPPLTYARARGRCCMTSWARCRIASFGTTKPLSGGLTISLV